MTRVKISHPSSSKSARLLLLQNLSKHLIWATRIIPINDGYIVLTASDEHIDHISKTDAVKELIKDNFSPILPPDQRSKGTILAFNADEHNYI